MTEGSALLVAMLMISAVLALIMLLAWLSFGRPRHAASWAAAFTLAAMQWVLSLALPGAAGQTSLVTLARFAILVGMPALLTVGFAQRVGRPARAHFAITGATLGLIFAAGVALPLGGGPIAMLVPLVFRALLLILCARYLVPRGRPRNFAERATQAMLLFLAFYSLSLAVLSGSRLGFGLEGLDRLDGDLLLIGLPAALTGLGMFCVLLLAADLAERMRELATRDPLTGVYNRRGFEEVASRMLANARRRRSALCVTIADIDRFKAINDRLGHAAGDLALVRLAAHIESSVRAGDLVGRMGGEEFAIVLADTDEEAGVEVVERIRAGVEALGEGGVQLTASFGVACLGPADTDLGRVLDRADRALYASKLAGRNRVTAASGMNCFKSAPTGDRPS